MKVAFLVALVSIAFLTTRFDVDAKGRGGSRSHSTPRPYYGGGKHTESHSLLKCGEETDRIDYINNLRLGGASAVGAFDADFGSLH